MVSDHPTENDTTALTPPSGPAAPAAALDSEETSAPLPSPVSAAPGRQEDAERAMAATPGEPDSARKEDDQAANRPGESGADVGESAGEAGEVAAVSEGGESVAQTDQTEDRGPAEDESEDEAEDEAEVVGEMLESATEDEFKKEWYILKVQVNREDSIRDALIRRVKIEGLEAYFGDIVVPTEEVAEFNKSGKRRVVRRKLYPGYILVHMAINDDTWFVVRETPGVGDFTGSAGKPSPMEARDVDRILRLGATHEERGGPIKTAIPFKSGDRVRVKDGHFQNFEGEVDAIDEANGRITVMINIFNRSTPVELEHWQVESV